MHFAHIQAEYRAGKLEEKGIEITLLDLTVGGSIKKNTEICNKHGNELSPEGYAVLSMAYWLSVQEYDFTNSSTFLIFEYVLNRMEGLSLEEEKIIFAAYERFTQLDRKIQKGMAAAFGRLDSKVREREMQENLACRDISALTSEATLIIVGRDHFDGILLTLKDADYRTPLPQQEVRNIVWGVKNYLEDKSLN